MECEMDLFGQILCGASERVKKPTREAREKNLIQMRKFISFANVSGEDKKRTSKQEIDRERERKKVCTSSACQVLLPALFRFNNIKFSVFIILYRLFKEEKLAFCFS